jgi:integrase
MKLHLTERTIAKLLAPDPSGKQTLYWDSDHKNALAGFAVLCSGTTSTKTYICQRTLKDGRNRRVTVGAVNGLSLDKARELAADILHQLRHGNDPKKKIDVPTLRTTLEAYLKARKQLRPASIHVYRQVERLLSTWMDRPLGEITSSMVEDKHRSIAAAMKSRNGGRNNGHCTSNGAMKTFSTMYTFAQDRCPDLPANPVRRLKKGDWFSEEPRKPSSQRRIPPEKLAEFYLALRNLPNRIQADYLTFLLFSGMRRTEAAMLKWSDVDLVKRIIDIPAENTKPGRNFVLPMSDLVHDLLVPRRALGDSNFIFPGNGAGHHVISTTASLKIIAKATGIKVSPHDLRRTFSDVVQVAVNGNWLIEKKLLNHSIKGDVTALYPHLTLEQMREPVQKVADRLRLLCGIGSVEGDNVRKLA